MSIPAAIVAGIGGILYYQNANDDFASWSYMWTLIPGFVGVGTILAGLLGEHTRSNLARGLNLIGISAVMFLVFATLFGGVGILGPNGAAIALIVLGVYILLRGFLRNRGPNETR
jgi:peptidoglycan/LPS O-acetylase OafA/YrhL